jgi:hypothetical protein
MAGAKDPSDGALVAREMVRQFEGLLLDYVRGLLSEMDDGLFLLSFDGDGSDGEVRDSGEDGGGVEEGIVVAQGQDSWR